MEELIVILVIGLIAAPLILSIIAMVMALGAKREVRAARDELKRLKMGIPPAADEEEEEEIPEPVVSAQPPPEVPQTAASKSAPAAPPPLPSVKPKKRDLELAIGGKLASIFGIVILVLGVAFFVGYAIKHGWIGPGMRVLLGMLSGAVLIGLGHFAEMKNKNLQAFARVLTGGGASLLFFSVFTAYSFYDLIGPWTAAGGLVATALAVMGLSIVYRSQTVALIGVLGAFITPVMIGGDFSRGLFPLMYMAVINVVVLTLGVRRNWQSLYNVAFVFTAIYTAVWVEHEAMRTHNVSWHIGLLFTFIYFAQFITLGLVKLKDSRGEWSAKLDMGRMLLSSLLLMASLYFILDAQKFNQWIGLSFLVTALLHIGLVKVAWRWLPRFKNDVLVLIAGAVTFATLALPAQLDGVWVSLGWAIEGLVLSWLASRYKVGAFFLAGIGLGFLGLAKAMVFDLNVYDIEATRLFFNQRFMVSVLAAGLLGIQAWIWGKREVVEIQSPNRRVLESLVLIVAALGLVLAVGTDSLFLLGEQAIWGWMNSSIAILLAALFIFTISDREQNPIVWTFGIILLIALPIKIILIDFTFGWYIYNREFGEFFNLAFLVALGLVLLGAFLGSHLAGLTRETNRNLPIHAGLNIVSLISGILLVTREIARAETPWKDTAITLWWAACALILIFLGLKRQIRYLRYTALVLFGVTILKVFLVDLEGLSGLIRVAAFMGVGIILLILSFTYQRIAPKLKSVDEPEVIEEESSHED